MYRLIIGLLIVVGITCKPTDNTQSVVDKAIKTHGSNLLKNASVEFDFRDRHYTYTRDGGSYEYTRAWEDSLGAAIKDYLNNEEAYRTINDERTDVEQEQMDKYANSVNSVLYFALLPYALNDPAVNRLYLGTTTLKDNNYHVLKITFDQEGGGKDFEDEFLYWIHEDNHTLDYLAYSYETDGGGIRFRTAYNRQKVGGITFQDYINYKPKDEKNTTLEQMQELYESGQLKELSRIETENVVVVK